MGLDHRIDARESPSEANRRRGPHAKKHRNPPRRQGPPTQRHRRAGAHGGRGSRQHGQAGSLRPRQLPKALRSTRPTPLTPSTRYCWSMTRRPQRGRRADRSGAPGRGPRNSTGDSGRVLAWPGRIPLGSSTRSAGPERTDVTVDHRCTAKMAIKDPRSPAELARFHGIDQAPRGVAPVDRISDHALAAGANAYRVLRFVPRDRMHPICIVRDKDDMVSHDFVARPTSRAGSLPFSPRRCRMGAANGTHQPPQSNPVILRDQGTAGVGHPATRRVE